MHEYIYQPDDDSEHGPVWLTSEWQAQDWGEDAADAKPAELVIDLDNYLGHYITAEWLQQAADLLEDDMTVNRHDFDQPENFGLRDWAHDLKWTAREAHQLYNDDPDTVQVDVHWIAHQMEELLAELGYVPMSSDMGVQTFRIIEGESTT